MDLLSMVRHSMVYGRQMISDAKTENVKTPKNINEIVVFQIKLKCQKKTIRTLDIYTYAWVFEYTFHNVCKHSMEFIHVNFSVCKIAKKKSERKATNVQCILHVIVKIS